MLAAKVTSAIASDSQRTALARLPSASTTAPPRIGSQMRMLRRGQFDTYRLPSGPVVDEHGQEHDQADDHRECIVIEAAGLQATDDARHQADEAGAAVDHRAVDQLAVDGAGGLAQLQAAARQAADPEIVGPVLVLQHLDRQ